MTDDQFELVTAYVDGEATLEERALVEADAELVAEVERQRVIRAELHDVEPPSAAARESAIAAALAAFDDEVALTARAASTTIPPAPDVTAPTNIVPFDQRRRMRWMQGLGAAAAVTAVVVAGAVIATRGGDDEPTAVEMRDSTLVELDSGSVEQGDAAVQPPAAEVASTGADELMVADTTTDTDAAAAADAAATESEDDAGTLAATEPAGAGPAAPVSATNVPTAAAAVPTTTGPRLVVIATEDDLLEFADTMKTTPLDADDAESACSDGALKAEATFEDEDGATHPIVLVTVDDDTIGALALDDCDVALEADR